MVSAAPTTAASDGAGLAVSMVYHRMYGSVPPRSELCLSQLTDGPGDLLEPPASTSSPPDNNNPHPPGASQEAGATRTNPPAAMATVTTKARQSATPKQPTIRIVCISDTHNLTPPVPNGDVLLHAGDLTNQGSHSELQKQLLWLSSLPHELKIVISGNHDGVTLDAEFHAEYHSYFKTPAPESSARNIELMNSFADSGVVYLCHEFREFRLRDGRRLGVFGSPWTPKVGLYGFQIDGEEHAKEIWSKVPGPPTSEDGGSGSNNSNNNKRLDILLTHGPARYMLDSLRYPGCDTLRSTLEISRPRLHVFGHVHASHGAMRVKWEELNPRVSKSVKAVCETVEDPMPERKTIFKVDLRGVVGGRETCLVNAAIKEKGSKAVVVELEVEKESEMGDGVGE